MTEELVLTENNWLYFKQSNVFTVKKKGGGSAYMLIVYSSSAYHFSKISPLTFD